MIHFEKTCTCINECTLYDYLFRKGREYQVDVYPLYYQVYNNGGYDDYVFLSPEDFEKYFKMIE